VTAGAAAHRAADALAEGGDHRVVQGRVDPVVGLPGCHLAAYRRGSVAAARGFLVWLLDGDGLPGAELEGGGLDGDDDEQPRTPHESVGDGGLDDDGGALGVSVGVGLGDFEGDLVGFGMCVGDGGGVYGAWPSWGATPSTLAGGGNCLISSPSMSRFMTSVHVSAG